MKRKGKEENMSRIKQPTNHEPEPNNIPPIPTNQRISQRPVLRPPQEQFPAKELSFYYYTYIFISTYKIFMN